MIESRNTNPSREATGIVAPFIRLATHLGYCCAIANFNTPWEDRKRDIQTDLREALRHVDASNGIDAYVSESTVIEIQLTLDEIADLSISNDLTAENALPQLQAVCHNIAYAMAIFNHDLTGQAAAGGTEI